MINRSLSKSLGLVVAVSMIAACGGDQGAEAPPAATPEAPPAAPAPSAEAPAAGADLVAEGRQIFAGAGICFTCHGQDGVGTPLGPALNDGSWLWIDPSQDLATQLEDVIRRGVPAPQEYPAPMPPMGGASLNDQQIEAVVAYVVSLNQ